MQLNHFDAELSCGVDLFQSGIDEQADSNAGGVQPFDCWFQCLAICDDIQAALGGDFLPFLRNKADFIRHDA